MINMEIKNESKEMSNQEAEVILTIASRNGCGRDGDIINFFVKEDEGIVKVMRLPKGVQLHKEKQEYKFLPFVVGVVGLLVIAGCCTCFIALIIKFLSWLF